MQCNKNISYAKSPYSNTVEKMAVEKTSEMSVGIDEVGRGCLAGPVVACAVIWPNLDTSQPDIDDSKKLTDRARRRSAIKITQSALSWGIGICSAEEIDRINIRQASLLAMRRAVENCPIKPEKAWVDGHDDPGLCMPTETIIQGDAKVPLIACASIVAKVFRDDMMAAYAKEFSAYGFGQHKGYGTQAHLAALKTHGVSPLHRRSFRPVSQILAQSHECTGVTR